MDQEHKAQAARIAAQMDRSIPPETPYLEKVGLMNNNRLEAEDQVVRVSSTSILPFQEQLAGHWADESGRLQFLTQAPPITLTELHGLNVDAKALIEDAPLFADELMGRIREMVEAIYLDLKDEWNEDPDGIQEPLRPDLTSPFGVYRVISTPEYARELDDSMWISDASATQILASEAFWMAIEAFWKAIETRAADLLSQYGAKPAAVRNRTQALVAYNMWVQTRFPTAGLDEVWLLENLSEPWFTKIEPLPLPTARS